MAGKEPFILVNGFVLTEEQVKAVRLAVSKFFEKAEDDAQRTRLHEVLRTMGYAWKLGAKP